MLSVSTVSTREISPDEARLVGSDRVLTVLIELANHPDGVGLDSVAKAVRSPKTTVHRALASLCRSGLAKKDGRGHYILGDEFLRLAFSHHESRPDHLRVQPILRQLAERFHETVHYAILDGPHIIYRAKVDPSGGSIRLTSTIGGRNPAHSTAIGKVLLSQQLTTLTDVQSWVGSRTLERRTERTVTTPEQLHHQLELVRERGYGVDDQENERGVNCIAVAYYLSSPHVARGAISISALTYRTSLEELVAQAPMILSIIQGRFDTGDETQVWPM
jgi:DNA-binding IclR family transcriptional regulator